jgi:hypothetical protein
MIDLLASEPSGDKGTFIVSEKMNVPCYLIVQDSDHAGGHYTALPLAICGLPEPAGEAVDKRFGASYLAS